ncbi:MAG: hypothetical protein H0X29_07045 [Parachlamydiaceae bacterium]|nr:hypothetical protein [Parachlamydiaceae bacterium]
MQASLCLAPFRQTLQSWAHVDSLDDFTNKFADTVLGTSQEAPLLNSDVAKRVCEAISEWIRGHESQFTAEDCPNLVKLQQLARNFEICTGRKGYLDRPTTLEKTISAAIILTEHSKNSFVIYPNSSHPLKENSVKEHCKNILNPGRINPPNQTLFISKSKVMAFVENARDQFKSDCNISKQMIAIYFKNAGLNAQNSFFSFLRPDDDIFFSHIISSLPQSMTHCNLARCALLQDQHVEMIVNRLKKLQSLDISYCPLLTDKTIESIAKSQLQILALAGCNLTNQGAAKIFGGLIMESLETLDLSRCNNLTDEFVENIDLEMNGMLLNNNISLKNLILFECPRLSHDDILKLSTLLNVNIPSQYNHPELNEMINRANRYCESKTQ